MKKILLPIVVVFAFAACTSQEEVVQKEAEKKAMEQLQKEMEATKNYRKRFEKEKADSENKQQNGQK